MRACFDGVTATAAAIMQLDGCGLEPGCHADLVILPQPHQAILEHAAGEGLTVEWVLDTHPHADHLMASAWLKERTGAPNAIGEKVREIAGLWRDFYNLPGAFDPDAAFDRLFADGDTFRIKIWDETTGETVYDNWLGAGDDAYDGTALGGGLEVAAALAVAAIAGGSRICAR